MIGAQKKNSLRKGTFISLESSYSCHFGAIIALIFIGSEKEVFSELSLVELPQS